MSEVATPERLWLPPPDARLIDPLEKKIETPVDARNLIIVDELIEAVKSTVDPSYEWPGELSIHHLYWPMAKYPYSLTSAVNPDRFRNLPIHKALVPRVFENWLHYITIPPPVPEEEVMRYRVEAWNVACNLFKTARSTVLHEKRSRLRRIAVATGQIQPQSEDDEIGEDWIRDGFERNFRGWNYQIQRNEQIPPEHRIFEEPIESPHQAATTLGKIVVPGHLTYARAIAA